MQGTMRARGCSATAAASADDLEPDQDTHPSVPLHANITRYSDSAGSACCNTCDKVQSIVGPAKVAADALCVCPSASGFGFAGPGIISMMITSLLEI